MQHICNWPHLFIEKCGHKVIALSDIFWQRTTSLPKPPGLILSLLSSPPIRSPPPLSFSSSSMLFLMLSYSSSMFWLPRIWLSTRRAFWVSPRWINQRGLSGRNRNPTNWSMAGSTDRPNMYLKRKGRKEIHYLTRFQRLSNYTFCQIPCLIWIFLAEIWCVPSFCTICLQESGGLIHRNYRPGQMSRLYSASSAENNHSLFTFNLEHNRCSIVICGIMCKPTHQWIEE